MGEDEKEIKKFFTSRLIDFFESETVYHVEGNGEALLIFNKLKLARTDETMRLIVYTKKMAEQILSKS